MINAVLADIKLVRHHFKDLIIDAQLESSENTISWPRYIPGISKRLYAKEYEFLRNERQYSLVLDNNGIIQFHYTFKDDVLKKARLAYYPYPVAVKEDFDELEDYFSSTDDIVVAEYYYDLANLAQATLGGPVSDPNIAAEKADFEQLGKSEMDVLEENFNSKYLLTNTSHLRFDYDAKVESHNKFEIQYSSINNIRIPSSKLIFPFVFMDFIIRNEYLKFYAIKKDLVDYQTAYNISFKRSQDVVPFTYNNFHLYHK